LRVPAAGGGTPPPLPKPSAGANETTEAALDLVQLQDFVEEGAPALTKILAGSTPEFAVKIRLKGKKPADLAGANAILKKINSDWKFGS